MLDEFDIRPLLKEVSAFTLEQCSCFNPQVIINPKLPELLIQHGTFYIDGKRHYLRPGSFAVYDFQWSLFRPADNITYDDIQNAYVCDETSGETWPIWFLVPCGHCDLCQEIKLRRFCNKCLMESQMYKCDPIHMVLTYSDKYLPKDGNVSYKDVCLFKKRFLINLKRAGYNQTVRICDSSEYGDKHGRPHYHLLIWNLDASKKDEFYRILRIAYYSWRKCRYFVLKNGFKLVNQDYIPKGSTLTLRQMGVSPDRVFEYVGAYIGNPQRVAGKAPTWVHTPKGKIGGLGAPFLDKHMSTIRRQKYHAFKFRERFSGKLKEIIYDRYVLNRCFPSKYTSVPYKLRRAVMDYAKMFPLLPDGSRFRFLFDKIHDKFSKYFFVPILDIFDLPLFYHDPNVRCPALHRIAEMFCEDCWCVIWRYMDVDFSNVLELDSLRKVVLCKLFEKPRERDKVIEQYKLNLSRGDRARKRKLFWL